MKDQQQGWNQTFEGLPMEKPQYDDWLDKYKNELRKSKDISILDLGCGLGANTLYLMEQGYEVVSLDFSIEALKRLKHFIPQAITKEGDRLNKLDFDDNSFRIIIADLSIHYFPWEDTKRIIKEIKRVLKPAGVFLCRINSTKDTHYGAGAGIKIEENYYLVDGRYKRFFDEEDVKELFTDWKLIHLSENSSFRYKTKKALWEIGVQNI